MPKKQKTKRLPKDKFFEKVEGLGEALTFDDVRLKSGYSEVMPDDVNLESKFSRNISLKFPSRARQWILSPSIRWRLR